MRSSIYDTQLAKTSFDEICDLTALVGYIYDPVAPVAYQVILEPGIGQFCEFESPRVRTRISSWGLFLGDKSTCGKRESVS